MEPLDLTQQPPRSPREKLAGVYFLPRTIDKMRALLPGGNIGVYNLEGMSTRMLSILDIPVDALQAQVAQAKSDDDVAAWVLQHSHADKRDEANRVLSQRTIHDVPPENRERIKQKYPAHHKIASGLFFDIIEADDAEMFARTKS